MPSNARDLDGNIVRVAPVGWISEVMALSELARLNQMTRDRKRGAA